MVGVLESRIGRAHKYASHRLHGQRTENQFGVTSEVPHFWASSVPILFFCVAFKRQNRSTYPYAPVWNNHPNVGKDIPYMERREASIFLPAKVEKAPHARLGAWRGPGGVG